MTVYRSMERGSWIVQRTFRRVGRVRRATGLSDLADAKEFERLLLTLDQLRRDEILGAFRDGLLSGDEIYRAYQLRGIEGLPSVGHIKPLRETMEAWVRDADLAPKTRREYAATIKRLLARSREASVADLPAILARHRGEVKGGRSFNLARAVARSFASGLTGQFSPLWNELSNIRPRPVKQHPGRPQTPDEAREIAAALGRYGGMWWTLCTSGMSGGPDGPYFLRRFDVTQHARRGHTPIDGLAVHGAKREGRERVVPLICAPVEPLVLYPAFARALRRLDVKPNDGRHSYEAWLEQAGVPKARRRRYMGHGIEDVTDLYGDDYPLWEFLEPDAIRIREFIGDDWRPAMAVVA